MWKLLTFWMSTTVKDTQPRLTMQVLEPCGGLNSKQDRVADDEQCDEGL